MSESVADQLRRRLERGTKWPIEPEKQIRARVRMWSAFRESDDEVLRRIAEWPGDRQYVIDNLPEKIAEAYGVMLFGEDPEITAAEPDDQERLDELVQANELASALQEAEELCVSEGEVWWRITVNPDAAAHPLITWHSRADVVPLLHGRTVVAAAFISRLPNPEGDTSSNAETFRHVEIQSQGRVENLLYIGRKDALGDPVSLGRHPETADLRPVWDHEIPAVLAGRIANKLGRNPYVGISDYVGVWTQFLVLNEATTIGRENMRLTAKKRAVVPASAVQSASPDTKDLVDRGDGTLVPGPVTGRFDAGEDLFVVDPLDLEEGRESAGPFRVLEYSFDAEALIAYKRDVVETVCVRCDIVPQFIGQGDFGQGDSGTALRVRLLPTINAAQAKARPWDGQLPRILQLCQLAESKPRAEGGIGRTEWKDAAALPSVRRTEPLPEDPMAETTRHVALHGAELLSLETSLRGRFPKWSDEQITDEMSRIRGDAPELAGVPEGTPPAARG